MKASPTVKQNDKQILKKYEAYGAYEAKFLSFGQAFPKSLSS